MNPKIKLCLSQAEYEAACREHAADVQEEVPYPEGVFESVVHTLETDGQPTHVVCMSSAALKANPADVATAVGMVVSTVQQNLSFLPSQGPAPTDDEVRAAVDQEFAARVKAAGGT